MNDFERELKALLWWCNDPTFAVERKIRCQTERSLDHDLQLLLCFETNEATGMYIRMFDELPVGE